MSDLDRDPSFEGIRKVLGVLRDRAESEGNGELFNEVRMYQLDISDDMLEDFRRNGQLNQHLTDTLSDVKLILTRNRAFIDGPSRGGKRKLKGGADSQALAIPTSAFKNAAPVNSDNAWYKIA